MLITICIVSALVAAIIGGSAYKKGATAVHTKAHETRSTRGRFVVLNHARVVVVASFDDIYDAFECAERVGGHVVDSSGNDVMQSVVKPDVSNVSDGYHTFKELYDFRREYNAALVNYGPWPSHKSWHHNDGELCFGGGWFIVVTDTPYGQISNHYEAEHWDEFHCDARIFADPWDGHTSSDVLDRLHKCNATSK